MPTRACRNTRGNVRGRNGMREGMGGGECAEFRLSLDHWFISRSIGVRNTRTKTTGRWDRGRVSRVRVSLSSLSSLLVLLHAKTTTTYFPPRSGGRGGTYDRTRLITRYTRPYPPRNNDRGNVFGFACCNPDGGYATATTLSVSAPRPARRLSPRSNTSVRFRHIVRFASCSLYPGSYRSRPIRVDKNRKVIKGVRV